MKVTFFSNYFNNHQLPLASEFEAMQNVEYTFVSLLKTDGDVGRSSLDLDYPFVLREYENEEASRLAMCHVMEDDLVVFGDMAGKEKYVKARDKTGKLFFRYAERLLKRGDWWRFMPPKIYRTWDCFTRYKNSNMYVLCASAYTAPDLIKFGFPAEKCLKWGYFPKVDIYYGPKKTLPGYKTLCSAQRLIAWKRVDLQIQLASRLKHEGYSFILKLAGDGPERENLEKLASKLHVDDCIQFLGELSHEDTIQLMRNSEVFIATSNRKEGWGATINEAMASGCCVVASDAMGSVPFLIENGVTGLMFEDGNLFELVNCVGQLCSGAIDCDKISINGILRIRDEWSARQAASSLYKFSSIGIGSNQIMTNLTNMPTNPAWSFEREETNGLG